MTVYIRYKDNVLNEIRVGPGIFEKYFLSFPQKNLPPKKTERLLNDKIYRHSKNSQMTLSEIFIQFHHSKIEK